jgi:FdhD protein
MAEATRTADVKHRDAAAPVRAIRTRRWKVGGAWSAGADEVATEEPLELRVNGRSIAVMMRTPGHDEELAMGFLLAEGVVRQRRDLGAIRRSPRNAQGNVLDVFLAPEVSVDLAKLTRHVFGASSCGLCGKATIASVHADFPKARGLLPVRSEMLLGLPATMRQAQRLFGATGGLHAAALFDPTGRLLDVREDVGRHNAVDKLLGRAFLDERLPLRHGVLVVSGRASFEIVQKALAGGVPVVAAIGAPSSLAVEFARGSGQTLIGFLRDGRFNVYAGARRIRG